MRRRTCSVRGCEDKTSTRHSFPKPELYPELFKQWVNAWGNEKLLELSPEEIYKLREISHMHFTQNHVSSNIYLKKDAYPTLNLPVEAGPNSSNTILRYEIEPRKESSIRTIEVVEEGEYSTHKDLQDKASRQSSTRNTTHKIERKLEIHIVNKPRL